MDRQSATLLAVGLIFLCISLSEAKLPGWTRLKTKPHAAAKVTLNLYLAQRNLEQLEKTFWQVSSPNSPRYGKYLTVDELAALVGNHHAVSEVRQWLQQQGIPHHDISVHRTQDAIKVSMAISDVERLFNVEMHHFQHPTGRRLIRSLHREVIPASVSGHINLITGISDFPPALRRKHKSPLRHELLKGKASPVAAKDKTVQLVPGTASILTPRGADRSISIPFNVVCKNGQLSQDTPPCNDAGPVLTSVYALASSNTTQYDFSDMPHCEPGLSTPYTVCTIVFKNLKNYEPIQNVTLVAVFQDGSKGPSVVTPFLLVPSPMQTIASINQLYRVPPHSIVTHYAATQAVVEFEEQYYSPDDLTLFFRQMGVSASPNVNVVGPNMPDVPGGEANLDIQWLMGLAPGSPTTFWSIAANSTAEIDDILQWAYAMLNTTNPPLVNSISYGMSEMNVDKYLGAGYVARSDIAFQKLAVLGVTIIIACGDSGAGDLGGPPMGFSTCDTLHADWPSQSPYITSVGSTYSTPYSQPICYLDSSLGGPSCLDQPIGEVGVSVDMGMRWTTGGGFSNLTTRPAYQQQAVQDYLGTTDVVLPPAAVWNRRGRAYPDVSTIGHNLLVALSGSFTPVDGTSASAPIFAGLVTLLNDARLRANKAPLGFLNPLLYQMAFETPSSFYDVTVGYNACGAYGSSPVCCPFGYRAARGWDPVSGLGTPNYEVILDYVLKI